MKTMLALVLAVFVMAACAPIALAWTETYSWASQTGATYNVWVCDWTTATTPCAAFIKSNSVALTSPTYTLTDTNAVLTEVEVEACNTAGCTRRAGSGWFHDASRVLPLAETNLLVQ